MWIFGGSDQCHVKSDTSCLRCKHSLSFLVLLPSIGSFNENELRLNGGVGQVRPTGIYAEKAHRPPREKASTTGAEFNQTENLINRQKLKGLYIMEICVSLK